MPDSAAPQSNPGHGKGVNFGAVVAMSGVVLVIVFVGACLFLWFASRHLLPATHSDQEPYSYLSVPGPGSGVEPV
ncbi:MAG TPA: hypothetical protein VMD92_09025 [Acidobacteriaceae bacterium]|nr:hypothetical protein [Acidobacteriaceae bacterium]